MLILQRRLDQSIVITTRSGETILVTVTEIRGDKVRLGFDAEMGIRVNRLETEIRRREEEERHNQGAIGHEHDQATDAAESA